MVKDRKSKSLEQLLKQVNAAAPGRSTKSDGWIGDKAHASRKSEHNPDADGTVDAIDITHDPKGGCDGAKLSEALRLSKDRRIGYVIFNKRIFGGIGKKQPFVWRKYTGANGHTKHMHIDVQDAHQDDASPWKIDAAFKPAASVPAVKPAPKPKPAPIAPAKPVEPAKPAPAPVAPQPPARDNQTPILLSEDDLKVLQQQLIDLGYTEVGGVDGKYGTFTRTAIRAFRADNHLPASDHIDRQLLDAVPVAAKRVISPERSEAPAAVVTAKVPEAKAHWWNKWLGWLIGGSAGTGAVIDAVGPARGVIDQVRDVAADVPGWVWLLLIAVIAIAIARIASGGEKKSVEAFRDGSRR